jgi:hypothetical protein
LLLIKALKSAFKLIFYAVNLFRPPSGSAGILGNRKAAHYRRLV